MSTTFPGGEMTKYRAQILANDGERWVDGGLFGRRANAEADACRLARRYGNLTRIVREGPR